MHDIDGSLTGQTGAIIKPGIVDVSSNLVNIVTPAARLPNDVSGFNATDGAVYVKAQNMWVHAAGSVIGKMIAFTGSNKNQRPEHTIERSDDGAKILFQNDAQRAAATEAVWMRDGNRILVKSFADRFFESSASRGTKGDAAKAVSSDPFRLLLSDKADPQNNGQFSTEPAPFSFREDANPTPLPTRPESTSETVEIDASDPRWSDAGSWDNRVPAADNIVIIKAGQRIVLDASATFKGIIVNGGDRSWR